MATTQPIAPIILDLGKTKKRLVSDLKRGQGRMMDEVEQAIEDVRVGLGSQIEGKELVPIVIVYRTKSKRPKRTLRLF